VLSRHNPSTRETSVNPEMALAARNRRDIGAEQCASR